MLEGRRGLVLGVARQNSAGFACAELFTRLGARLAISCRPSSLKQGAALAEHLNALPLAVEVSQESTFEAAAHHIATTFGGLDFVVHTLVAAPPEVLRRSVLELSRDELAEIMDVGVRSLLVTLRFMRPLLKQAAAPRVIALTSAGADFAIPHYHAVGMAKAALNSAVRYLAAELGRDGILCNALSFSAVASDTACRVLGSETLTKTVAHIAKRGMTGQAPVLGDVASTAAFLVSRHCANLTGQVITVDSGFSRSYF